jgi:fumarate reductase subunit C
MSIRNPRDFWAGVIYLALAAVALWIGRNYSLGSSARMGPGYFPVVLGSILAVFGIVSIGRSLLRPGEAISAFAFRPLVLVLGSVALFGLLLDRVGVLIALPCLIVVSALASRHSRIDAASVSALVGMVAFCVIVFVKGLGVPMPLFGTWFGG